MQNTPSVARILIADEHRMFREGLRKLLEAEGGLEVVGEAGDGVEAVGLVRELRPDVLLLDVALPTLSGLEVLGLLTSRLQTAAVFLTGSIDTATLIHALQGGARGVVMKQSPFAVLREGLRQVMAGQYWIGRESASDLMQAVRRLSLEARQPPRGFGLTPRELEVTAAIVAAYSNREIAQTLALSEKTVKHHLTHIFDKLGVSTRLELAAFAQHHGLELPELDAPARASVIVPSSPAPLT